MSETYNPAFAAESEAPKPIKEGDYIEGIVAEADPNAISEKPIERHEGVVTKDKGKTWEVTGVIPDKWGDLNNGDPIYIPREVFKDGASKKVVPRSKQEAVEEMQRLLEGNSAQGGDNKDSSIWF